MNGIVVFFDESGIKTLNKLLKPILTLWWTVDVFKMALRKSLTERRKICTVIRKTSLSASEIKKMLRVI